VSRIARGAARAHDALIFAMAVVAAAIAGGLVVLICADVALRNLRLGNIPWSVEASEYGLYAITLLGAPWVLAMRGHVAMDLLVGQLRGRPRRVVDVVTCGLGALICAVLVWKGLDVALGSHARGALVIKTLIFPEWWLLAPLPAAMAMLALGFLRLALESARGTGAPRAGSAGGH
jgi:TRAP-type transport system small permease protein